ncbi:MAG: RIP metalloprotease RseP [Bacteroidota bacterium]
MEYVVMIGQLILSLSILIVLHEMGHFFPARLFGTRVEKFYLFFDPYFSLFKYKKGETEYGIGWLPLGGYVKISGMIDESMDREQMKQPPQPWEFRSKKAWQRLIIMLGGVTVNFILGFFIWAMVLWVWGERYMPTENVVHGIYADSLGQEMGLRNGDKVLGINGKPFTKFNDRLIVQEIIFNDASEMEIERNGQKQNLPIDPKWISELSSFKNKNELLFMARFPFVIGEVSEDEKYPAKKAGIKEGDQIIAFDGTFTPFYDNYRELSKANKGKNVDLTLLRAQDTVQINLTLNEKGNIGVIPNGADFFFDEKREQYSLLAALPAGTKKGWNFLANQIKAFGQMFKGKIKASESLGGFKSIGGMFGYTWNWERFWTMTAILSLILAFMNLLPIPALDGGHVMFLLYEVITGRKPSDKFMEYATIVGFVIVLGLVIYANALDFIRG